MRKKIKKAMIGILCEAKGSYETIYITGFATNGGGKQKIPRKLHKTIDKIVKQLIKLSKTIEKE